MRNFVERIKIRYLTSERKIANRLNIDLARLESFVSGESIDEYSRNEFIKHYKIDPTDENNNVPLSMDELNSNKLIIKMLLIDALFIALSVIENTFILHAPTLLILLGVFTRVPLDLFFIGWTIKSYTKHHKNILALALLLTLFFLIALSVYDVFFLIRFLRQ